MVPETIFETDHETFPETTRSFIDLSAFTRVIVCVFGFALFYLVSRITNVPNGKITLP